MDGHKLPPDKKQDRLLEFDDPQMAHLDRSRVSTRLVNDTTAREMMVQHHYAHSMPAVQMSVGVYVDEVLNAVVCFGQSATPMMKESLPDPNYLELVRLFSFDWAGKNIESFAIARAIEFVRTHYPHVKCLVSFADPKQGHVGGIYQATNWLYCGQSDDADWFVIDGGLVHPRSVVAKYGTSAHDKLRAMGIQFTTRTLPGKHRYIYLLGSKSERRRMLKNLKYPVLPYPKKTL